MEQDDRSCRPFCCHVQQISDIVLKAPYGAKI